MDRNEQIASLKDRFEHHKNMAKNHFEENDAYYDEPYRETMYGKMYVTATLIECIDA